MTDKPYVYQLDEAEARLAEHVAQIVKLDVTNTLYTTAVKTPSTVELLAGGPFRGNDVMTDAAWWSVTLQQHDSYSKAKLPRSVAAALRDLSAAPTRMKIVVLRGAAKRRRPEWDAAHAQRLQDIEDRCVVYLATLGDVNAILERTALAFRAFDPKSTSPLNLDLLIHAITASSGVDYEVIVEDVVPALTIHAKVLAMILTMTDMRAWLGGYRAAVKNRQEDTDRKVLIDSDVEQAEIRDMLDERFEAGRARPSGLVVVPSLDHLPKPGTSSRDRRDTPRAEFDGIAGKRLPFKRCERDIAGVAIEMGRRFPWMTEALDVLLMDLATSPDRIAFQPTILAGPPGTGKTTALIALCDAIGLPATVYSVAGVADGAFQGTSRQYSTGRGCVPVQEALKALLANPAIILDETEKFATSRHNGSIADVLLTMTAAASACRYHDPYLECAIDLSAVSFLGTVNDPDKLSGPLRDRFRILHVPEPSAEHVPGIVAGMMADLRKARSVTPEFLPDLAPDEVGLIVDRWKAGSMRGLRRTVETVLATRDRLATRN